MKTTTQTPSAERLLHDVSELKKLGADAVIENGGIVIKGDLLLYYEEEKSIGIDASIVDNIFGINGMLFSNAREIQDDFMPRIKYVNGSIYFKKLEKVGNNFMQNLEGLYGCLNFDNLKKAGNNFMQNLVFIGMYPLFCRLEEAGNFMQNLIGIGWKTYANGMLSLYALQRFSGVQEIKCKYYRKYGFAYFDEILSKVEKVSKVDDFQKWYYSLENDNKTFEVEVAEKKYTIYSCLFGKYIARKGKYTARAETVEQAINDLKRKLNQ